MRRRESRSGRSGWVANTRRRHCMPMAAFTFSISRARPPSSSRAVNWKCWPRTPWPAVSWRPRPPRAGPFSCEPGRTYTGSNPNPANKVIHSETIRDRGLNVALVPRVARLPGKPIIIFDGECTFCRRWIARARQTTGERVEYIPLQSDEIAAQYPELGREDLESAVHLVEPDGQVTRGAEAAARLLAPDIAWPLWLYQRVPGVRPVAELAYQ